MPSSAAWRPAPSKGENGVLRLEQLNGPDSRRRTNTWCARGWSAWRTRTIAARAEFSPTQSVEAICRWAHRERPAHASRRSAAVQRRGGDRHCGRRWAQHFDTVSVCFSKGLGAPVGSALAGPKNRSPKPAAIASCLAAACGRPASSPPARLYALEHHVERLADDHANAKQLAEASARRRPGATSGVRSTRTSSSSTSIHRSAPPPSSAAASKTGGLLDAGRQPHDDPGGHAS